MKTDVANLSFNQDGLLPAIVQDYQTGKVLMLAYMNEDALKQTIETEEAWFFSRSRQELWNKGATSGNKQQVKQISYDCDQDTLLIQVNPLGPACHTGAETCFNNTIFTDQTESREVIHQLVNNIKKRRQEPLEESYTTYLFREGIDKVLKKVGEETSEVIIGAKNEDKQELTWEIADLTYHTLVLMELAGVSIEDIKSELHQRHIQKTRAKA